MGGEDEMESKSEISLDSVHLTLGAHASREDGMCALEAIAWLAGEPHGADPVCVCPVLAGYFAGLNDTARSQEERDALKPYLWRAIGTSDDGREVERSWMALDWLVRVQTPTWLEAGGLQEQAAALRAEPEICERGAFERALPALMRARKAWDDAWDAARDDVWDAAGVAAADAAASVGWYAVAASGWDAGVAAAWVAAFAAARRTPRPSAWPAAIDAALGAVRGAAKVAAWDDALGSALWASQPTPYTMKTAARTAAQAALRPVVDALRASAMDLLGRMVRS